MAPHRKTSGTTLSSSNKTSKQTAKGSKHNNIDYSKLQISDVLCPLCRNILIEPITLPCQHCFCWRCLQGKIIQQEDMGSRGTETCPQCQVRFGGWYRTAKKQHKLLTNQPLWKAIRENFLKTDNPLHPFLLNGVKKRVPTQPLMTQLSKASILPASAGNTPPQEPLLLTLGNGNDSNDSSCAEDAIRRECNHFRPIDGHLHDGHYSLSNRQQHSKSVCPRVAPNAPTTTTRIMRVPTTRAHKYGGDVVIRPPCGPNSFFSDPRLSAFYLLLPSVPTQNPPQQEEPEPEAEKSNLDFDGSRRVSVNNSQRDNVINNKAREGVPRNSNATTVIMLQQPKQINTHRNNGLIKAKSVVAEAASKMTKRKYRIKQQPQRQSARRNVTVAARQQQPALTVSPGNNGDVDSSLQLQADRQLARELHRLLNGGATRTRTATLNHSHQLSSSSSAATTAALTVHRESGAAMRRGGRKPSDVATVGAAAAGLWRLRTRQRVK